MRKLNVIIYVNETFVRMLKRMEILYVTVKSPAFQYLTTVLKTRLEMIPNY